MTLKHPRISLFFASLFLFLLFIQFPLGKNYDEAHYVPSAKQFISMIPNQNYEHPPLGKELMAIGIATFGDRPIGWRFMSTVAGAFTLVGVYEMGIALFASPASALLAALLAFFNFLLYVQARVGMLDTFMMAFLVWGLALSLREKQSRRNQVTAGLCFGFAVACKWAAVFGLLGLWGVIIFDMNLKKIGAAVLDFGILPIAAYFATFLPFLWVSHDPAYTLRDLIEMQFKMYDGQLHVVAAHTYMSNWYGWPVIARPIWYAFERYGPIARGVLCIGNPFLMWGGLICIALTAFRGWRARSRVAFYIVYFYLIFTFCWAVVPRKVSFYYYYYPAAMLLTFAWVYALEAWVESKAVARASVFSSRATWSVLAISITLFIYFLPILAGFKIPVDGFTKWTWFTAWI